MPGASLKGWPPRPQPESQGSWSACHHSRTKSVCMNLSHIQDEMGLIGALLLPLYPECSFEPGFPEKNVGGGFPALWPSVHEGAIEPRVLSLLPRQVGLGPAAVPAWFFPGGTSTFQCTPNRRKLMLPHRRVDLTPDQPRWGF